MLSELFATVSGAPPDLLLRWVPPSVRRPALSPATIHREGGDVVIDWPIVHSRRPGRYFVPAFSALTEAAYSFRFEASAGGPGLGARVGTAVIGEASFDPIGTRSEGLRSEIDVFVADSPVSDFHLRLRLRSRDPESILTSTWMVTLSVSDAEAIAGPAAAPDPAVIAVPPASQFEEGEHLGERVCSPTSVAMVLRYWGRPVTVPELAAEIFHPGLDLYGVWPSAIQAAARRGVPGYLLRFPDWDSAAWCLARGLPLVASVRYALGELTDAAIPATSGHLLVLTGVEDGHVHVNDPAAPDHATVRRRYRLDEFCRVWLDRTGVGYVFCPPP